MKIAVTRDVSRLMNWILSVFAVGGPTGLRWLWLTGLVLACDQGAKWLADTMLALHQPVHLAPFLDLTLTYNTGAAFSLLSQASGWQRWFFAAIAATVSFIIVVWLRRISAGERVTGAALALILGGAIGNAFDRIRLGYVIDFIDVYVKNWHWPAFNVADSAITVGATILILESLWGGGRRRL